MQVSSDQANALGIPARVPVELNVTALRREAVDEAPVVAADETASLAATDAVETETLDPIAAGADETNADGPDTALVATAAPPKPAAPARVSQLDKLYIQIGIFSVEANAENAADEMRRGGMVPTVFEQETNGKSFWRVVVDPAQTRSKRAALLQQIQSVGFTDAYEVTN